MATDSAAADLVQTEATELSGDDRPYQRSWVNVIVDGVVRLPGPSWVAFLAITVALALLSLPQTWVAGLVPVGTIDPTQAFWGAAMGIVLWLYHYLDGVARAAVDAFRPATTVSEAAFARLRYELTVVPARPAAVILLLSVVLTPVYYIADPVASDVVGYSPIALLFRYVSEVFFGSLVFVLIYHSLRQLRAVSRAYAQATRIDLFHPRPLYGFAGLTARTGIAVLLVIVVPSLLTPAIFTTDSVWIWASYMGLGVAAALAVFVLPLRGVHSRLVVEKQRLQFAAEDRLKAILAELARDVDAVDLSRADAVNKTLGSLIQQREVLARLPTWPWSPGTLRGFVSIILLPIALFLAQRILLEILAIGG
jgi:hypothetical protein